MEAQKKRWKVKDLPMAESATLRDALNIHPLICALLWDRGIRTYNEAKSYFRPGVSDLHDPFLMRDMQAAVNRILAAIDAREKILIYGDYDVDGTTSVAIVFDFLQQIYDPAMLEYYIPNRYREGYGLSAQGIEFAVENGHSLMILLDCGIKSVDLIAKARSLGIDTIICDHHFPGDSLPDAVAILNPKQKECNYPYADLCGCGVGFKLIQAIAIYQKLPQEIYLPYLELVATAIAADIVPITGENRTLAFLGIKQVNTAPSTGIKALMELSRSEKQIQISNLAFMIGPRINAAGRMDDAKKAVSLFIEKDLEKARAIAGILQIDNTSRKEADASITIEALDKIKHDPTYQSKKSTVVFSSTWHKGVIGIVASRLIDKFYRPTVVLTQSGELLAGSARSIPGFNIHDCLERCSDLLVSFGGHYFAAGMTLRPENLEAFCNRFESIAQEELTYDMLIPELTIDGELELGDISNSYFNIINQMEPFGPENPKPVFCIRNLINLGCKIVKEDHVRFELGKAGFRINGIGFNMAELFKTLNEPKELDIICTLDENNYRGNTSIQLRVIDFDIAGKRRDQLLLVPEHI
jgi:single-stranded-DNA-specific exonuclease